MSYIDTCFDSILLIQLLSLLLSSFEDSSLSSSSTPPKLNEYLIFADCFKSKFPLLIVLNISKAFSASKLFSLLFSVILSKLLCVIEKAFFFFLTLKEFLLPLSFILFIISAFLMSSFLLSLLSPSSSLLFFESPFTNKLLTKSLILGELNFLNFLFSSVIFFFDSNLLSFFIQPI